MTEIKIFVTYKDKHKIIKSDIITPIQTGRAIADEIFEDMIGDDTGDNISKENPKYNELSAQYWVWKNYKEVGNPEYVGFMHYRRHFLFNENLPLPPCTWLPDSNVYIFPEICEKYLEYICDDSIKYYFPKFDCVVIKPYDVKNINNNYKSIKEQYITLPEQEAWMYDVFVDVVLTLHPEYVNEINDFLNGTQQYLCNMFIMKKELFFEYSEFLFSTLEEIDKRIISKDFSNTKARFLGYFGEFLLSIFILKLKVQSNAKIKELNASFIYLQPEKNYKKYYIYKCLRYLTWGKAKKHYKHKSNLIKKYLITKNFFK